MVSRIPEYRSWVLTTSASKSPGSWGGRGEKHQQLHGQTPTHRVPTTLPVPQQAPGTSTGRRALALTFLLLGLRQRTKKGLHLWQRDPVSHTGQGTKPAQPPRAQIQLSPCSQQPSAQPGCPPCPH